MSATSRFDLHGVPMTLLVTSLTFLAELHQFVLWILWIVKTVLPQMVMFASATLAIALTIGLLVFLSSFELFLVILPSRFGLVAPFLRSFALSFCVLFGLVACHLRPRLGFLLHHEDFHRFDGRRTDVVIAITGKRILPCFLAWI